ncbi:Inner membrane transport protein YnfM [Pseudodesulfovibrio hydrargyri]|uniref:Inner membrane transport protein YnfM n=1 Tax=Pseudodesulfovibrio hydrargyri TaxID=2125990 RepID=A0A1J5MZS5_9BACT|nr:MFS transporter [Pseudodesulfovibrio hydrargyri]OIQ51498.1 Inner membrane transport protein YnfM [Pseudodesulfovibrio hydrargyri]
MTASHTIPPTAPVRDHTPPASLVLFLAAGAGAAVAALYYCQPLMGVLGADIGASGGEVGWVPTLTQLGYALGILFLAPLGDRFDRRNLIMLKAALLAGALLLSAMSPSIVPLLAASLGIGVTATLAQDIVPMAAHLAPDAQRGRIVGTIMTGLLLGIVLSRVASGYLAAHFGWRSVFYASSASIVLVGIGAWRKLPRVAPTIRHSYGALLRSLAVLWRAHPGLRRAAVAQGLLSLGFSAFWSTLALMLFNAPFHLGSEAAGAFGLAGAAGALAAPVAGRMADRKGPESVTRLGAALVAASFAAMFLMPALPPVAQLILLGVAAVGFDLGVQASLIAHQTIIYALDPEARSRLNAVLFVGMFSGMSAGSALGSALQARWGWGAVTALATLSALGALAVRLAPRSKAD